MKHLIDEARRTMCEEFGVCEDWAALGPEVGAELAADMRTLMFSDEGSEEMQDVFAKWGDALNKNEGIFAKLSPEARDQLLGSVEASDKDGALAALAADGLDYLNIPDDWEEACGHCQDPDEDE